MALGVEPVFTGRNRFDILAELPSAEDVCNLDPDIKALAALPPHGIRVTAVSDLPQYDFVSRFFAPSVGVEEDPVTGSAHCCLGPYWGENKKSQILPDSNAPPRVGLSA
jgi:predicted PhzF superfamily epimerase YddE/YHI9